LKRAKRFFSCCRRSCETTSSRGRPWGSRNREGSRVWSRFVRPRYQTRSSVSLRLSVFSRTSFRNASTVAIAILNIPGHGRRSRSGLAEPLGRWAHWWRHPSDSPRRQADLQRKDKKLLFRSGRIEKGEMCIGISFRLRSPSYDGTRQRNILRNQSSGTDSYPDNKSGLCCQY